MPCVRADAEDHLRGGLHQLNVDSRVAEHPVDGVGQAVGATADLLPVFRPLRFQMREHHVAGDHRQCQPGEGAGEKGDLLFRK